MRRLSISILNMNQPQLTIDILEKLKALRQDTWDIQLILVDNGSEDKHVHRLTEWTLKNKSYFNEILYVISNQNLGASGGHNLALQWANCERILFLDNDVILPDDIEWLNSLWENMDDDARVGLVGPMLVFSDHPEIVQGAGIGLTDNGRAGYLNRGDLVTDIPADKVEVVASPSACWLMRRNAQQEIGLFPTEFFPMQYGDVDICVRLFLAGWKIICNRALRIPHIENVTTRQLKDYPYARTAVKHWMIFREKWAKELPKLSTITEEDIYWGPIPRINLLPEK